MSRSYPGADLPALFAALDPAAGLAHRHLWLIDLLDWVRGRGDSVPAAVGRVQLFLDAAETQPDLRQRLQVWWATVVDEVDITTLLADFGFAPRTALVSEIGLRLRTKLLPGSPETIDAAELQQIRQTPSDEVIRCEECQRILVRTPESGL